MFLRSFIARIAAVPQNWQTGPRVQLDDLYKDLKKQRSPLFQRELASLFCKKYNCGWRSLLSSRCVPGQLTSDPGDRYSVCNCILYVCCFQMQESLSESSDATQRSPSCFTRRSLAETKHKQLKKREIVWLVYSTLQDVAINHAEIVTSLHPNAFALQHFTAGTLMRNPFSVLITLK